MKAHIFYLTMAIGSFLASNAFSSELIFKKNKSESSFFNPKYDIYVKDNEREILVVQDQKNYTTDLSPLDCAVLKLPNDSFLIQLGREAIIADSGGKYVTEFLFSEQINLKNIGLFKRANERIWRGIFADKKSGIQLVTLESGGAVKSLNLKPALQEGVGNHLWDISQISIGKNGTVVALIQSRFDGGIRMTPGRDLIAITSNNQLLQIKNPIVDSKSPYNGRWEGFRIKDIEGREIIQAIGAAPKGSSGLMTFGGLTLYGWVGFVGGAIIDGSINTQTQEGAELAKQFASALVEIDGLESNTLNVKRVIGFNKSCNQLSSKFLLTQ